MATRSAGGLAGGTTLPGDPRIFGSVPQLPSTGQLQSNLTSTLNSAIPGFSDLSASAAGIAGNLMAGELSPQTQNLIRGAAAQQAVAGGMPGTGMQSGSLFGNRTLRDLGLASENVQQQGFNDFLSLLQGTSGTSALTPGMIQDQQNSQATLDAAPIPSYAIPYMQNQFLRASNPAGGTGGVGGGRLAPPQRMLPHGLSRVDPMGLMTGKYG